MSSEDHWRFGEDLESVHPDRDEVLIYVRVIPTEDNQRDAAVLRGAWDAILAGDDVTGARRFGWRTFIMRAAGKRTSAVSANSSGLSCQRGSRPR